MCFTLVALFETASSWDGKNICLGNYIWGKHANLHRGWIMWLFPYFFWFLIGVSGYCSGQAGCAGQQPALLPWQVTSLHSCAAFHHGAGKLNLFFSAGLFLDFGNLRNVCSGMSWPFPAVWGVLREGGSNVNHKWCGDCLALCQIVFPVSSM